MQWIRSLGPGGHTRSETDLGQVTTLVGTPGVQVFQDGSLASPISIHPPWSIQWTPEGLFIGTSSGFQRSTDAREIVDLRKSAGTKLIIQNKLKAF